MMSPKLPGCAVLPAMESSRTIQVRATPTGAKSRKTADRFSVINGFVDCSLAGLSRAEALTWLVLWRYTKNGTARTGTTDIARRVGTSKRAVLNALAGLRKRGLIERVYHGGINRGVSVYRVHPLARPHD